MFPEGRALEFLIVAIVALVVVGPKDLPVLLRRLGQFVGKLRNMAAEFRASFDEMARQSELDELRREVEAMRKAQYADLATHTGHADMTATAGEIHQNLMGVGMETPPPPYTYAEATPPPPPEPPPPQAAPPAAKPVRKPRAASATGEGKPKPKAAPRKRKTGGETAP